MRIIFLFACYLYIGTGSLHAHQPYPPSPKHEDVLKVADGWEIYYAETGNPNGIPVVFVHGGPGFRVRDKDLLWFDPDKYRILAFEQRGSGRSHPSSCDTRYPASTFADITIDDLAKDMEKLREHLAINQWFVFGGSWGAALSLFYAQEYPKSVKGLILRGVTLVTDEENKRFYNKAQLLNELGNKWNPASLQAMIDYANSQGKLCDEDSLIEVFYELILRENDFRAMHLWISYEEYLDDPTAEALEKLLHLPMHENDMDPFNRSCSIFEPLFFATLPKKLNLLSHERIERLKKIPVHIVQGKNDSVCPPEIAEKLATTLKEVGCPVYFQLIEKGAHSPDSPAMTDALIDVTQLLSLAE